MKLTCLFRAGLLALLLCAGHGAQAETTQAEAKASDAERPAVTDAWVRRVPPAARMTAGYLRIHNPGPEPVAIIGAGSPFFGSVEMHGTITVDGMSRMREHERLEVPAGETLSFEPGGLHLMLMQAREAIPASGEIPFTLLLEDGRSIDFSASVGQPGS
ncbi:MAG TPA: copper chaperone PCu(A)C [Gammaproteobacteria bacterium]|nr:copper chaperone PCu(A)C [Gammaproteobacteria bacterium]